MPGSFSKATRPVRPGAYFNWEALTVPRVPPAVGSVVCVVATGDWGPFKQAVLVESYQEFVSVYGPTLDTPMRRAVWQAFTGEGGFDGRWGAGAVLMYRGGGASAAKSSRVFQNATPAAAMTLTAKYEGTYGNNISVTTQDHVADSTQNELLVIVNSAVVETYVYADTNIADLVAQINANSDWVTATLTLSGVALAPVTSVTLTGGNDGSTMTAGDWAAVQTALESERFDVFVPYALTDAPTLAALMAWAGGPSSGTAGMNSKGKRFEVVLGGAANETVVAAIARSLTFNDGNFVNLGMSSFRDNNLLDVNGNPVILSPAEFAARFAGVLAQRGEAMATTFARFPGVDLLNGPSDADITKAFAGGVVVFSRDSDLDAPVHVEKGITTYTSQNKPAFPYVIYRNPKFMRTMQNVEVEFTAWGNRVLIGRLTVNNKTRDQAIAEVTARLGARAGVGIVQPGFTVEVDTDPPPSDDDEFIALRIGVKFGRSVEQMYFTVKAG